MSQENVEIVRRAWDAITRRDLDGFLALMDSEVVAEPRILAVEGGALRGHDGIREWWESVFGAFPDFDAEVIEIREGGHMTISNVRVRGRGAGSDVPFEDDLARKRMAGWEVCLVACIREQERSPRSRWRFGVGEGETAKAPLS
jgi:ketosteroid isomerase-like protein